jgi:hypothetical protein
MGLGVGLTTLPCKKKIVEKPPRNSAGFCGGGQGLGWAVEPRKEEVQVMKLLIMQSSSASRHFLPLTSRYNLSILFSNTLNLE